MVSRSVMQAYRQTHKKIHAGAWGHSRVNLGSSSRRAHSEHQSHILDGLFIPMYGLMVRALRFACMSRERDKNWVESTRVRLMLDGAGDEVPERRAQCKGHRFSMHSEKEAGAGGLSEDIEE